VIQGEGPGFKPQYQERKEGRKEGNKCLFYLSFLSFSLSSSSYPSRSGFRTRELEYQREARGNPLGR
jgi:hypothetical protein